MRRSSLVTALVYSTLVTTLTLLVGCGIPFGFDHRYSDYDGRGRSRSSEKCRHSKGDDDRDDEARCDKGRCSCGRQSSQYQQGHGCRGHRRHQGHRSHHGHKGYRGRRGRKGRRGYHDHGRRNGHGQGKTQRCQPKPNPTNVAQCYTACRKKGIDAAKCKSYCSKSKQPSSNCKKYTSNGQNCVICYDASGKVIKKHCDSAKPSDCYNGCLKKGASADACKKACSKPQPGPTCKKYTSNGQNCAVCYDASGKVIKKHCEKPSTNNCYDACCKQGIAPAMCKKKCNSKPEPKPETNCKKYTHNGKNCIVCYNNDGNVSKRSCQ